MGIKEWFFGKKEYETADEILQGIELEELEEKQKKDNLKKKVKETYKIETYDNQPVQGGSN